MDIDDYIKKISRRLSRRKVARASKVSNDIMDELNSFIDNEMSVIDVAPQIDPAPPLTEGRRLPQGDG